MPVLAVSVVGHDSPGVIAAVSGALADLGGNLEDSSMTLLREHFAMTLIVAMEHNADDVAKALARVTEPRGLVATVWDVTADSGTNAGGAHYLLRVHGGDRPGIVAAVTSTVAAYGGNITDLTTRLVTDLYVL